MRGVALPQNEPPVTYTSMEDAWLTPQTTRAEDELRAKFERMAEENRAMMESFRLRYPPGSIGLRG
jgi:hypothetical protein